MVDLDIPAVLEPEFETVRAVWQTPANTRALDALVLSCVKYEKQTRRLFTFLVFQHPKWTQVDDNVANEMIVRDNRLTPERCLRGVELLSGQPMPQLLGETAHSLLWAGMLRVKTRRNKLFHGQLTGESLKTAALENDVRAVMAWMEALATAANRELGYDGLARGTAKLARTRPTAATAFPYGDCNLNCVTAQI